MDTVVFSLGGSLVNPGKPDRDYVKKFASLLLSCKYRFGVVVGGGKNARIAADMVRAHGGNEFEADEAAVSWTKKNAKTAMNIINDVAKKEVASPVMADNFSEARSLAKHYKVVVMGGTIPGITTDTDAVLLAECLRAKRVINLSNVNGVYASNPKKNPKAKKFGRMSYLEMIQLAGKHDTRAAGTHFVFDFVACKLIARSKIEAHFLDGRNLGEVRKAIEGKGHSGTVVDGG
jgi:uridylate kinase